MKDYRIHETEHIIRGGNRKRITIQNTHARKQTKSWEDQSFGKYSTHCVIHSLDSASSQTCNQEKSQLTPVLKKFIKLQWGRGELGEEEAGELSQDVMYERIKENK